MLQVTNALWAIEDWVRSVREVLMTQEDVVLELPQGVLVQYDSTEGGGIKLIRGCPPPDDPCDDDGKGGKGGKGHGFGHVKGKGKTKTKPTK
jgi:hypothetical protein